MREPMIGDHLGPIQPLRAPPQWNDRVWGLSEESIRHEDVARVSAAYDVFDATASRISVYLPATPAEASAVST